MNSLLESPVSCLGSRVCPAGGLSPSPQGARSPEPTRTLPDTSSDPLIRTARACAAAGEYVLANAYLVRWLTEAR